MNNIYVRCHSLKRLFLIALLVMLGTMFASVTTVFADSECPNNPDGHAYETDSCMCVYCGAFMHTWTIGDQGCRCINCGATKVHNLKSGERYWCQCKEGAFPFTFTGDPCLVEVISVKCVDCSYSTAVAGRTTSHSWGKATWYDLSDDDTDYEYCWGQECSQCGDYRNVVKTVKKGKTKRIIPKKAVKHAKKKWVKYNKKKVKATKDGKVKGKKRGSTARVIWDYKFKDHRGNTWWESYEVTVKVK